MSRTGPDGAASSGRRRGGTLASAALRVVAIAGLAAGLALSAGSDGYWFCVPAALLACSWSRTALGGLAGGAIVLSAAIGAGASSNAGLPPLGLALLVPLLSIAILSDLRHRLERDREAMRRVALTDPLTGLANRRLLMSRAAYEIARHTRAERRFALVMIDLDGFKLLNDRLGHAAGDQMLRNVATSLTLALRAQDTIARLGGDEFCVIAPETERPRELATRIVDAVSDAADGFDRLRASVGVAMFPDDGHRAEVLMEAADERLLAVKRSRRTVGARRRAA